MGSPYIGAVIERQPLHAEWSAAKAAAGAAVPDISTIHPDRLADLLWAMHHTRTSPDAAYPEGRLSH